MPVDDGALLEALGQASNMYAALELLEREQTRGIDLQRVSAYRDVDDRKRLDRLLRGCRSVDDFLSAIARSDSDLRIALPPRRPSRTNGDRDRADPPTPAGRVSVAASSAHSGFGQFLDTKHRVSTARTSQLREMGLLLRKRTKNNVIVCAEAGTGKTRLVEAFASAYPEHGHRVFRLDFPKVVGGSKYRGDLEGRLVSAFELAIAEHLVLFVDEIHSLAAMGSADGGLNVLDVMKPYLSNVGFRLIGATTPGELTHILADTAFRRRFNLINLPGLSLDEIWSICLEFVADTPLAGLQRPDFERACRSLSDWFPSEHQPDISLDFLEYFEVLVETGDATVSPHGVDVALNRYAAVRYT